MKLLQKSTKIYLVYSLIIFVVSIPVFYFLVRNMWIEDVDETLGYQRDKIVKKLKENKYKSTDIDKFSTFSKDFDIGVQISQIDKIKSEKQKIITKRNYDKIRLHIEPYRQLISDVKIDNQWYRISVQKDLVENEDLIQGIVLVQTVLFMIFLFGIMVLNHFFSRKIWNPFYFLVSRLQNYKIDSGEIIDVENTDIEEFTQLNHSVQRLTQNNVEIFKAQKEFIENASHESQTPIAVIRNQIDLLFQDERLSRNQLVIIKKIDKNLSFLSKLNRNLLLLTKIENRQFPKNDNIFISELISELYESFTEILELKKIHFEADIFYAQQIISNAFLIHSLFYNLFTNAIKYNIEKGNIEVEVKRNVFRITNTGANLPLPKDKIFDRFYKQSIQSESYGLGLSIVKKICETLDIKIDYHFTNPNRHTFFLFFE